MSSCRYESCNVSLPPRLPAYRPREENPVTHVHRHNLFALSLTVTNKHRCVPHEPELHAFVPLTSFLTQQKDKTKQRNKERTLSRARWKRKGFGYRLFSVQASLVWNPASDYPCILSTLRQIIHVFYQSCVILSMYFINSASDYPCICQPFVILSMYFINSASDYPCIYQPFVILSMYFINHASSYPCILSTMRHLIYAFYQSCIILSMYFIKPASFYPCTSSTVYQIIRVFYQLSII